MSRRLIQVSTASKYTYDSENRLITAAVAGGSTPTVSYDYDAVGRRITKTVSGVVTNYLLDGDEEIAEYSGTTVLRRYITGPGVDDRIAHVEISPAIKTYYHANHQGSVMAMTDNAGNVTESMSYDEYGNGTPSTGEQFGYTGRRFDPETGLYYYRARYYAPQVGRFLQTDPVGYKDDIDLYTYVGNDPLDKTDPSGKLPDWLEDFSAGFGDMEIAGTLGVISLGNTSGPEMRDALGVGSVNTRSWSYTAGEVVGVVGTLGLAEVGKAMSNTAETATVTRYMGPEEAKAASESGSIPNVGRDGIPRPTHVTTDSPTNSASAAKKKYELPVAPTHRATVPASRAGSLTPTPDGRSNTSGGGSQQATQQPIPVKKCEITQLGC
jgi:RHS repeat-associated protein